ncbi:hypothetical protein AB0L70_29395 [Kribbella sp. NPDC051952]|uniref:hypothetical protein n=1 Tax=Kribbella sp. NPDC051952 TaxID=3154851 RepID=UPI003414FCF4
METIVAYAFDRGVDEERATAGVRRVEAYYGDLWGDEVVRNGRDANTVGLYSWSRRHPACNWPAWQVDQDLCVASLHAPLGYERVVGDLAPERAVGPLARTVLAVPARLLDLAPPFGLTVLDPAAQRLELFTDSIGLGRLFQLRTTDGWVWSNRPVAACLFADVPAIAGVRGWRYAAGCGWFMGDTTPYERVLAVPGATRIVMDGRRGQRTVTRIESWSGHDALGHVEETADALRGVARSVGRLWPGTPTVDLSGGRDSRVVAAAFLSAGVDVRLNSYGAEAAIAEELVAALPSAVEHVVSRPRAVAPGGPPPALPAVVDRVRRWHRYGEGLRPSSYLFHGPPGDLTGVDHLAIGGAGGEVAHGHFYPRDVLALDRNPLEVKVEAFTARLQSRLVPAAGPAPVVREAVSEQIRNVFREAIQGGLEDARMLDHFYVVERLRRWGTAGERSGVVSPLLVPTFVRGAFALTTPQRLQNALHLGVIRELVPQWVDVPFYQPVQSSSPALPAQVKRLGAVPDREVVKSLLSASADFHDQAIRSLWSSSVAGRSTAADEVALRQLLWRAVFDDHLAEVNQHISHRPSAPAPVIRTSRLTQRVRRNPTVRRLVRSRVGQTLRHLVP